MQVAANNLDCRFGSYTTVQTRNQSPQTSHNPAAESDTHILPCPQAHHLIFPFGFNCITSHLPRSPVSWSRDQMLWILPACSGWLLVFPQVHWCFSIKVSYTRPAAGVTKLLSINKTKPPTTKSQIYGKKHLMF